MHGHGFCVECFWTYGDTIPAWLSLTFFLSHPHSVNHCAGQRLELVPLEIAPRNSNSREDHNIMESIPIVLATFKFLVLGTGMYFAIKWHYDQGKKEKSKEREKRAVLRAAGKVAAIFLLSLLVLGLITYFVTSKLSLDLSLP